MNGIIDAFVDYPKTCIYMAGFLSTFIGLFIMSVRMRQNYLGGTDIPIMSIMWPITWILMLIGLVRLVCRWKKDNKMWRETGIPIGKDNHKPEDRDG